MPSKDTSLYFIQNIDVKNREIELVNYVFDKQRTYIATPEEAKMYTNFFMEALERNMFLCVEFDEDKGIIVQ
ncbi:DUF5511 family protein [Streptococcus agalactiae]|uniref:DUF5511 family protein n=1 Tax=Streptococcus agalactiae TaxID=1311 RepID=UPI002554A722|nr:DUF5511 family protein [Streptococcus agalactiae]MDK8747726.1 DUF5511 family protein [Streptococcus agalactiae]